MSARLVILGGAGLLGTVLAAQARADGRDVASLTSADCDVTDAAAPGRHIRAGDVVINCAAYTRVDDAERDRARAHAVNATGAGNVARACAEAGADLLHVSTDYVFDGDFGGAAPRPYETDDATHPLSAYGATKLAGEREVHAALPDATVVRTAWIFLGGNGTDFAAVMRRNAMKGAAVEVVADQIGSPTYAVDLASTLLSLADRRPAARVLHAANAGPARRYDRARAVYELVGADPRLVTPVGSEQHPRPAPRPTYSALGAQRSAAAGGAPLRPWRDAVAAALGVPLTGR